MQESLLKKQIKEEVDKENAPEEGYWVCDIANKIIDKAKNEYLKIKKHFDKDDPEIILYEIEGWFDKQFGDNK